MTANSFVIYALIFLAFSIISVPLSKRLGMGSVLGYLVAGALMGPSAFGFVNGSENLAHFAELGVVFLLFIIGLELQPKKLWALRHQLTVLGLGQTLGSTLVIGWIFHLATNSNWEASFVAGFALALSSTAFSLQSLIEKGELKTPYGQGCFSVLLMQDMLAIPALALIPILGIQQIQVDSSSSLKSFLAIFLFVGFLIVSSRTWVGALFRWIALHGSREIFTALTLFLVLGVSYVMYFIGLSMGLGAFLAGVLLADSEYRHEIEVDLEPFKALLMGFFFMAVGITVPLHTLIAEPARILGWVAALMLVKFGIMYVVGRFGKLGHENSKRAALYLALGGEFAFVISSLTLKTSLLTIEQADTINLVVTFSMVLTPLLLFLQAKIDERQYAKNKLIKEFDKFEIDQEPQVLIAGFGRFGQMFGRILRAQGIPFTAIDHDPNQIELLRKFGNKVYYGDCSREEILHAAGAQNALYIVLAIDDSRVSVETAKLITEKFPNLKIFARARNRQHAYELMDLGIKFVKRETFDSSSNFVVDLLIEMGKPKALAHKIVEKFKEHDLALLHQQYTNRFDEKEMINVSKIAIEQLEKVMKEDLTQSYLSFDSQKNATSEKGSESASADKT
jgi:glutathione-regulated potassium-efflux system ancillary protein KefC